MTTCEQEFSLAGKCDVPVDWRNGLRWTTLVAWSIALLVECILLAKRYPNIKKRRTEIKVILGWNILLSCNVILRSIVSIALDTNSRTSVGVNFLVHIMAVNAVGIVFLYVHVRLNIIKPNSWSKIGALMQHKQLILCTTYAVLTFLFLLGPVLVHTVFLPGRIAFWGPVALIDFTLIPYFCYLSIRINNKIQGMIKDQYKKRGRESLISSIICTIIGTSTGIVAFFSMFYYEFEWILFEACWIFAASFFLLVFTLFAKAPMAKSISFKTNSTSKSGDDGDKIEPPTTMSNAGSTPDSM